MGELNMQGICPTCVEWFENSVDPLIRAYWRAMQEIGKLATGYCWCPEQCWDCDTKKCAEYRILLSFAQEVLNG